jgi:hypothetical protein
MLEIVRGALTGLLGGYVGNKLLRLVPPKRSSKFDNRPLSEMRARNNRIDNVGTLIIGGGYVILSIWIINFWKHDLWQIGIVFGFPVALTLAFVCVVTLPMGVDRFREFWRFHELKHKTRLALLMSLYLIFAVIGVVSMYMVVLYDIIGWSQPQS